MKDLYKILDLTSDASAEEVKSSYKRKLKTVHPDVGGTQEDFLNLQVAYNVLSNKEYRIFYDKNHEVISDDTQSLPSSFRDKYLQSVIESLSVGRTNPNYQSLLHLVKSQAEGQALTTLSLYNNTSAQISYLEESLSHLVSKTGDTSFISNISEVVIQLKSRLHIQEVMYKFYMECRDYLEKNYLYLYDQNKPIDEPKKKVKLSGSVSC